jgi:purine-binding chemotaxis protein CheW
METKDSGVEIQQYLTFDLAGEEYAISILRIREIIEYGQVTRVPRMPGWVRGVINLRGNVVPVIDLAVKFGMPETLTSKLSCVILVEVEIDGDSVVMGVVAEAVNQVVDLSQSDIRIPPAFGTKLKADFLMGMGSVGKKFALILDIDKILITDELLAAIANTQSSEVATDSSIAAIGGGTTAVAG